MIAATKRHTIQKLDEPDDSAALTGEQASVFRTSVGILLYLSQELIECQNAIRALSGYMANPTRRAMMSLRHLVKYLLSVSGNGLKLHKSSPGQGHVECYEDEIPLETQSDSDWASSKGHGRSISSSMVFIAGNLLYSASRCQRLVSLSSAESEVHAATSTMCDGLFTAVLLELLYNAYANIAPFPGFHSCNGNPSKVRSGSRSALILWTQAAVASGKVALHKIHIDVNCADLGTKHMQRSRMLMLLHLLGMCDVSGNSVGEDEYVEHCAKQQFKRAIKAVQLVRQIMMAVMIAVATSSNA